MTYTLTFQINTETDPAQLLDMMIALSEQLANECEPENVTDQNGFIVEGDEWPEATNHTVQERPHGVQDRAQQ